MNRYFGAECPYCHQAIKDGDDLTVCPECGAPYHRHCAKEAGGCILTDLHAEGKQWQKIARPGDRAFDGRAESRCSRCGTLNPPGTIFCEICGTPLQNMEPQSENASEPTHPHWQAMHHPENGNTPPPYVNPMGAPQQMPFNPFYNPMAGLDPEELIEEIPAKEAAIFVRQNTHYFLPKFKDMGKTAENGKKRITSWNWAAFLFDCYYLFYRKMYGLGVIVMILTFILSIPSMLISFDNMMTLMDETSTFILDIGISPEKMLTLYSFCNFLSFALKLALSVFVNKFYKDHTFKQIKKIKTKHGESAEYHTRLAEKGGVSMLAVLIAFGLTMVISILTSGAFLQFAGLLNI